MAEKTEKKKKSTVALVIVLAMIIVALIVAVFLLLNKQRDMVNQNDIGVSDSAEKRNVVVNEDNIEKVLDDMAEDERVPAGNYEVTMNTTWEFTDGESASTNAYVENSTANTNDVYFDVLLADTQEKIFTSPLLPIGSHIENITLDKDLSAGSYNCIVAYSLVDEEQNVLSELQVGLVINVEN